MAKRAGRTHVDGEEEEEDEDEEDEEDEDEEEEEEEEEDMDRVRFNQELRLQIVHVSALIPFRNLASDE